MLDDTLLAILVCPQDRGPLLHITEQPAGASPAREVLYNPRLRRAYRVDDGIPVLLVDDAVDVDAAEHDRFLTAGDPTGAAPAE